METQNAEIVIYQNDFRNRTEKDPQNLKLLRARIEQLCKDLKEPTPNMFQLPSIVFCRVLFIKDIAEELHGRCACTLSADRSEMKSEIFAEDFSLAKSKIRAFRSMCKDVSNLQIRFVDGETVITAKYKNEPFVPDEGFLRSLLFDN